MKNTKDTRYTRTENGWLSFTPSGLVRLLLLALTITFVLGCQRCHFDRRPATIVCSDPTFRLEPGTCAPLRNPCNQTGDWIVPPQVDGIRFCFTPEQQTFFAAGGAPEIVTTRSGHEVTRTLCVPADSPFYGGMAIDYTYGLGAQIGAGTIFLTVAPRLSVDVDASPSNIAVGQSSQLVARVRGGVPPYFYSWVPTTMLNDTDIAAPIASPTVTTEYRVRVTDSVSQQVIAGTTITVGVGAITATAVPPLIRVGDVSVLVAIMEGGTPPYTFEWTPTDTLDDSHSSHPSATPTVTTTYQVTGRDSTGTTRHASATVTVGLDLIVTATPTEINPGEVSQLNAILRGGTPPYIFDWTPANTLDRPHDPNPIASPSTTTQYMLVARDSIGVQQGGSVLVTVGNGSPPPTASFVFNVLCCPTMNLDASASTGNIVTYTWDLGWTSANPDRITTSPTTSFTINEFDRGTITLTVTDASGRTATTTRTF